MDEWVFFYSWCPHSVFISVFLHNGLILFRELPIYVDLPASALWRKIHIFIIDYLLIDPDLEKNAKESCCFLREEEEIQWKEQRSGQEVGLSQQEADSQTQNEKCGCDGRPERSNGIEKHAFSERIQIEDRNRDGA